jgi:hypothetical protein
MLQVFVGGMYGGGIGGSCSLFVDLARAVCVRAVSAQAVQPLLVCLCVTGPGATCLSCMA